jgi:Methyltransferase domain
MLVLRHRVKQSLPRSLVNLLQRLRGRAAHEIPVGAVRFGDLRRFSPISRSFGFDRGTPIDRHYIEAFLKRHSADIRGRVLEIGDDSYTHKYGGANVQQSDVLSVEASNTRANFVGDLADPRTLPATTYDCIILTQTLQYIYDFRAAIASLFHALKPGGVLLLTVPSAGGQVDGSAWGATWYWWFTSPAISRLLGEYFNPMAVSVETSGNVFAATAFHFGVALEELKPSELSVSDSQFPIIVAGRAVK